MHQIDKALHNILGKGMQRHKPVDFYHGTSSENYRRIQQQGLQPNKSMLTDKPVVFLTANQQRARMYANKYSKGVLLKVSVDDTTLERPYSYYQHHPLAEARITHPIVPNQVKVVEHTERPYPSMRDLSALRPSTESSVAHFKGGLMADYVKNKKTPVTNLTIVKQPIYSHLSKYIYIHNKEGKQWSAEDSKRAAEWSRMSPEERQVLITKLNKEKGLMQ